MNKFNVAYIKLCTETEGPFKRCCIWFQGCNLLCPGCCNADLQPLVPKHIVTIDELTQIVEAARKKFGIEGVTLSGGEPSLQKGLAEFNKRIRQSGLGVIMFSGRYISELDAELVNSVDLLIAGPYEKDKPDYRRFLIGSTNKKIHFITNRYRRYANYFNEQIGREEVTAEDYIFINGD